MALIETQFHDNEAKVGGGAVFAGYKAAIRFRCDDNSPDSGQSFCEEKEWRALGHLESVEDICPSWKTNTGAFYGHDVGTYATTAQITIDNAENVNTSVCVSGGEDCVIERYRSGTDLPPARVKLLDGLGQGPARSHRQIVANMSSLDNQFLGRSVVLSMENGDCVFRSITSFALPGEYKLTVGFGEGVIKKIDVTVRVRRCIIGEMNSTARICVDCGIATYNFYPSGNVCHLCPENGDCSSRSITPDDGYWQKTPCSEHLRKCLPTSACESDSRSGNLTAMVRDVSSCDFEEEWIEDYTRAQCAEVDRVLDSSDV